MPRILVVYFSRGGNTRRVAEHLATDLGADLEEIVDKTSRSGVFGYQRSGFQAFFRRLAPIAPPAHDPDAYDLIVVGTPIWDMSLSSPVRSYLRRHRSVLPTVAFFCTCIGVGSERVFRQMTEESGREPVARLVLTEHDLAVPATPIAIARFAVQIRAVLANAMKPNSATCAIAGAR
jgi:flavodoxin